MTNQKTVSCLDDQSEARVELQRHLLPVRDRELLRDGDHDVTHPDPLIGQADITKDSDWSFIILTRVFVAAPGSGKIAVDSDTGPGGIAAPVSLVMRHQAVKCLMNYHRTSTLYDGETSSDYEKIGFHYFN